MKDFEFCTSLTKKEVIMILSELTDPKGEERYFCGIVFQDGFSIMKYQIFSNNSLNPYIKGEFIETDTGANIRCRARLNKRDKIAFIAFVVLSLCIILWMTISGIVSKYNFIYQIIALVCFELICTGIFYIVFLLKAKIVIRKLKKYLKKYDNLNK